MDLAADLDDRRSFSLVDVEPTGDLNPQPPDCKVYEVPLSATRGVCGTGTVHHVHRTLRAALNEAVRRSQIMTNPVLIAKAPRLTEEEIVPLTVKEATAVLTTSSTMRNGVRFALALALGLRQGEALGLQWDDLDEEARTLTIRRAIQRHMWRHGCAGECGRKRAAECPQRHSGGLAVVPTKSRAGRRMIGVPNALIRTLRAHRQTHGIGNLVSVGDGHPPTQPTTDSP